MNKRFVLFLLLLAVSVCEDDCLTLVSDWIDKPQNLPPLVYANSGKFLNDLGDYNNCLFNGKEYVYFTMQVVNRLASALQNMGLCAPIQCRQEIASNDLAKPIQDKLN